MDLCDEYNNCTKFQFYTEKEIFFVNLHHYNYDITSSLICINQNLELLSNQKCYRNNFNAILHHFESYFKVNKLIRIFVS